MRTDVELIRAARTDAGAFRELYDRYAQRIYRNHLRRTRDTHAAHDLTVETFAQAWLARRRFRGQSAVEQQIIGAGFLGAYAPSPGVG